MSAAGIDTDVSQGLADITIMGTAEARSKLWLAMGKARAAFDQVTKDIDGQTGQQKFKYANFAALSSAMVKPLAENGLSIIQMITTPSSDFSCVTTLLAGHGAELWVEIKFAPAANEHGLQATIKDFGAQTTYYKRYQLQAIGFIEGDRDADQESKNIPGPARRPSGPPPAHAAPKGGVVDAQLRDIRDLAGELGWSKAQGETFMKTALGVVKPLDMLSQAEGKKLIEAMVLERGRAA